MPTANSELCIPRLLVRCIIIGQALLLRRQVAAVHGQKFVNAYAALVKRCLRLFNAEEEACGILRRMVKLRDKHKQGFFDFTYALGLIDSHTKGKVDMKPRAGG